MLRRHSYRVDCATAVRHPFYPLVVAALVAGFLFSNAGLKTCAIAQQIAPATASPAAMPEPIYWKQHLFLIPYQWGSAAEPGAAQVVWLLVSKDHGTTWQKISDAKPEVKAFNYRAGADGEYWFAVRTIDKQGRAWPSGPYQPELRVIVDTTLPQIDELRAHPTENGLVEIHARATDLSLDPKSWKFEWQSDPNAAWQAVALQGAGSVPGSVLHGYWQPPAGRRPSAIRGTVWDRAGNSSTYQTRFETGSIATGPLLAAPIVSNTPASLNVPSQTADSLPVTSAPTNASAVAPPAHAATPPVSQPWPAAAVSGAPFQLWTSGTVKTDDGVTAYGSPPLFNTPLMAGAQSNTNASEPRVEAQYAGLTKRPADSVNDVPPATSNRPKFSTLEPYRESSAAVPASPAAAVPAPHDALPPIDNSTTRDVTPVDSSAAAHTPTSPPKLVGSRTFALEYDLVNAGNRAVSKVELWGTRDGGQSWSRYAQDDDNRSPLVVTVDNEGLYGFRILVQTAGGEETLPPRPGDAPELWVAVDLKRPVVELTAIERGQGNQADQLILRWRAADNNLEPRPIALFYSSRPAGPWSAIATNLENTGEYAWRVERFVPTRFYLRIEAHDTAGNLAAFQTREPVEFSPASLAGRLRSVESLPTNAAASGHDSYR